MNRTEYPNKVFDRNNKSLEKKKDSTPRSVAIKQVITLAILGTGFAFGMIKTAEKNAKADLAAAGLSAEMSSDPGMIWFAAEGHTSDEIRDFAYNLERNRALILNNNANSMEEMTVDLNTPMEDAQTDVAAEVSAEKLPLEKIVEGVYSFQAGQNMEITSQNFIRQVRESLAGAEGRVFVAVKDDDYNITRIFTDSTIDGYRDNYGNFYAYVGDLVYVATDGQALKDILNSKGINSETFGLP
ncbi:MAG: hypothetical protein UT13_C0001G0010 [Candidatus Pacebacteria bacterium GW2011_GWF2_38_9]|nr:MAG: hypothetical protein US01_C0001G0010 [candidate division TM6 bacterium GW2011_GWF2_28_16]KKQ08030.1 MAG: hypothetical protein US20_C0025G0008 [Candidatus Pacebacteria bacterium GW2011_GWF1_36_5]KKQ88364.1 MAG: hypothetical protein UT13_C0001G0010 [Candidatus Pacebacteria bacterium GW2011_GWF2_38_9]HAZ72981.1 hypothetical protein [Candidatus Paceibacterota bacterium]